MAIERLALKTPITGGTYLAGNLNGQDYRYSISDVLAYMQGNLIFPSDWTTQYASPSTNGFNVTITDGANNNTNVHLILTPVAGYSAGTVTLPLASGCVDGQQVMVNCTQAVSNLTVAANGATAVTGEPTGLSANGFFTLKFDLPSLTWYRVA